MSSQFCFKFAVILFALDIRLKIILKGRVKCQICGWSERVEQFFFLNEKCKQFLTFQKIVCDVDVVQYWKEEEEKVSEGHLRQVGISRNRWENVRRYLLWTFYCFVRFVNLWQYTLSHKYCHLLISRINFKKLSLTRECQQTLFCKQTFSKSQILPKN